MPWAEAFHRTVKQIVSYSNITTGYGGARPEINV